LSDYEGLDAEVLALSVDSPFAQEAWAKASDIKVPLLSDFNKEVCQAYGCMYEDLLGFTGVAKRSAFVIDKEGVLRRFPTMRRWCRISMRSSPACLR